MFQIKQTSRSAIGQPLNANQKTNQQVLKGEGREKIWTGPHFVREETNNEPPLCHGLAQSHDKKKDETQSKLKNLFWW